jgi:hypothetical protein
MSSPSDRNQSYGALPQHENNLDMEHGDLQIPHLESLHDRLRKKDPPNNNRKQQKCDSLTAMITGSVILSILATFFIVISNAMKSQSSSFVLPADLSIKALTISSVSNEYGIWDSTAMLPYSFLQSAYLVEPYKETNIVLKNYRTDCSIDWALTDSSGVASLNGTSLNGTMTVTVKTVGQYSLTAKEQCGEASTPDRYLHAVVWVKHVRRELSSLNDQDREEFLDAFHTLWTVSTTAGMTLYGDRYKSINYFATLHNDGGGNAVCDEFHGGLGFLNNHMFLSAYLEQSLQLVNPRVALHYMEYTKYFDSDEFQHRE